METYDNNSKLIDSKIEYILAPKTSEYLSQADNVVTKFLYILRKRNDLVFKLLTHAQQNDYNTLSSLLINCFYENIFSSSFIENELLILIYLSLKKEIFDERTTSKTFLKETINSSLFRGLLRKDDIRSYIGIILTDVLDKMENKIANNNILTFNIVELKEKFAVKAKTKNKNVKRPSINASVSSSRASIEMLLSAESDNSTDNMRTKKETKGIDKPKQNDNNYYEMYLEGITKKELIEKESTSDDKRMKEYLGKQIQEFENDDTIYQNIQFRLRMSTMGIGEPHKIYQQNFNIVVELIEMLFENFKNNIKIIPYSIKCICKIIAVLVEKRFPNITTLERNTFISEFFFEKIFKPIFTIPDFNGLITSVLVSGSTKKNIILLQKLIRQLINGGFFNANKHPDLTPFNMFFLSMMPRVFEFFDALVDVKLPSTLENMLLGQIDEDNFIYNYFEANPNEKIQHWSMCFTVEDVITIFNIIKNNEKEFIGLNMDTPGNGKEYDKDKLQQLKESQDVFEKTYNKLKTTPIYLEKITKKMEGDKKMQKKTFLLIQKIKFNKKLGKVMKINDRNQSYTIELPDDDDDSNNTGNTNAPPGALMNNDSNSNSINNSSSKTKELNVIRAKNFLSKILFHFKELTEDVLPSSNTASIIDILESIKIFLQTDYYLLLYAIPLDWYSETLMSLLKDLPDEYMENNYMKLYSELRNEVQKEIDKLNLSTLSEIKTKLKYTKRAKNNISNCLKKLHHIEINTKIQKFLESTEYEVQLRVKKSQKKRTFVIEKVNQRQNKFSYFDNFLFDKNDNQKGINAQNVYNLIQLFPDFVSYHDIRDDEDLTSLLKRFAIPDAINGYLTEFKTLTHKFQPLQNLSTKDEEMVGYEISNIVLSKLNHKLCAKRPEVDDIKITQTCIELSWVRQEHVIPTKQVILNNFLPAAVKHLYQMEKEKSPMAKMEEVLKIAELIQSTIVFSTGKQENSVDDNLPFMLYVVIKACPKKFASNVNFIDMFLDPVLKKHKLGHLLSQIKILAGMLQNFTFKNLINVTKEEYQR